MAVTKRDIGDLLVDNGLITSDEYDLACRERTATGDPMSIILSRMGLANESHFKNALELEYGTTYISLAKREPDLALTKLIPESVATNHKVVPVQKQGDRILLAMVDPNDSQALEEAKRHLEGTPVKVGVCIEEDFLAFVALAYPKPKSVYSYASEDSSSAAGNGSGEKTNGKPEAQAEVSASPAAATETAPITSNVVESRTAQSEKTAGQEASNKHVESAAVGAAEGLGATAVDSPVSPGSAAEAESTTVEATTTTEAAAPQTEISVESATELTANSADATSTVDLEQLFASKPEEPGAAEAISAGTATSVADEAVSSASPEEPPAAKPNKPAKPDINSLREPTTEIPIIPDEQLLNASSAGPGYGNKADESDLGEISLIKKAQEEAIVLLANQILGSAIKRHCSNIHIQQDDKQAVVHYRLNGALFVDRKLPKRVVIALIARYKMMARLNLAERSLPQDGHIKVKSSSKEIVCLVTTVPGTHGENVVIWIV